MKFPVPHDVKAKTIPGTEGWERMYPEQENVPKKIFGGYVIRKAYEPSAICAELVAPNRPVIVIVNRINFNQPVRMGDQAATSARRASHDISRRRQVSRGLPPATLVPGMAGPRSVIVDL